MLKDQQEKTLIVNYTDTRNKMAENTTMIDFKKPKTH